MTDAPNYEIGMPINKLERGKMKKKDDKEIDRNEKKNKRY